MLDVLGQFGPPGLLVVIAWLFWDKSPRVARASLMLGLLAAVSVLIVDLWPPTYDVALSPPESTTWGGFLQTGEAVQVKATLLRNGQETEHNKLIPERQVANRELAVEDDRQENRVDIKLNGHPQGYVAYKTLQDALWRKISTGDVVSPRTVALSDGAIEIGQSVRVHSASVKKPDFETLEVHVPDWLFREEGVQIAVYDGSERLASGDVTRDQELQVTYQKETVVIKLMTLDLGEKKLVQFLFLKYL